MNTAIRDLVTIVEHYCDYYFGRENLANGAATHRHEATIQLANAKHRKFQFTLNQDKGEWPTCTESE